MIGYTIAWNFRLKGTIIFLKGSNGPAGFHPPWTKEHAEDMVRDLNEIFGDGTHWVVEPPEGDDDEVRQS